MIQQIACRASFSDSMISLAQHPSATSSAFALLPSLEGIFAVLVCN